MYKIQVLYKENLCYIKSVTKNRLTVVPQMKHSHTFEEMGFAKIIRDEALSPHYCFFNICILCI